MTIMVTIFCPLLTYGSDLTLCGVGWGGVVRAEEGKARDRLLLSHAGPDPLALPSQATYPQLL